MWKWKDYATHSMDRMQSDEKWMCIQDQLWGNCGCILWVFIHVLNLSVFFLHSLLWMRSVWPQVGSNTALLSRNQHHFGEWTESINRWCHDWTKTNMQGSSSNHRLGSVWKDNTLWEMRWVSLPSRSTACPGQQWTPPSRKAKGCILRNRPGHQLTTKTSTLALGVGNNPVPFGA